MRRSVLVVAIVFFLPTLSCAEDAQHVHKHHVMNTASPNDPPIIIIVNPEVRISVTLGGALPPPAQCGTAAYLPVKIVNQGFVTAPVEVSLVDPVGQGVGVEFSPAPLKGIPEERRLLRVTLTKKGPVDITIAVRAKNEIPDLGGRDRVHFLMRCLQDQ